MKLPWGSITRVKLANGEFKFRARGVGPKRESHGLWNTYDEAAIALDDARKLAEATEKSVGGGATLLGYGRRWLQANELRRGFDREKTRFELHVATAPFAHWAIRMIEQRDVQRWVLAKAKEVARGPSGDGERTVSKETVKRALALLRSILKAAIIDGIIDTNPAAGVVLPRAESTKESWTWLTQSEIDAVLRDERSSVRSRSIFAVAIFAGLRAGELFGLRWEDVLEREVVVRHSRKHATKSGKIRRVPLLAPARDWLKRWKGKPRRIGLVWPRDDGGHHHDGYNAGWADVLGRRAEERVRTTSAAAPGKRELRLGAKTRAGIERRVRFHDLRHTCGAQLVSGTSWVERGWLSRPLRVEEVREWLGHSTIQMTERYAHLAPEAMRSAVVEPPKRRRGTKKTDAESESEASRDEAIAARPSSRSRDNARDNAVRK
jgi:integrase